MPEGNDRRTSLEGLKASFIVNIRFDLRILRIDGSPEGSEVGLGRIKLILFGLQALDVRLPAILRVKGVGPEKPIDF
jgi:hypothetical protein